MDNHAGAMLVSPISVDITVLSLFSCQLKQLASNPRKQLAVACSATCIYTTSCSGSRSLFADRSVGPVQDRVQDPVPCTGSSALYRTVYRTLEPVQDRGPCNDSEGRSLLCLASGEQLAADHTSIEHVQTSKSVTPPAARSPEDANDVNMYIMDIRWTYDHAMASLGLTNLADTTGSVPLADCCSSSPICSIP